MLLELIASRDLFQLWMFDPTYSRGALRGYYVCVELVKVGLAMSN